MASKKTKSKNRSAKRLAGQAKPKKSSRKKAAAPKPAAKLKSPAPSKKLKDGAVTAYLGLGSNVGEREEYIEQAVFLLKKTPGIKIVKRSANNESEAVGVEDQPAFVNAVCRIETTLSPQKLLEVAHEVEDTLGRERGAEWGPRTIDVDILFYDDQIISEDKLQIPHPLMHERLFVLKPLAEIAPDLVHPTLEKTVSELYEDLKSEGGGQYDDELPGFKEIKEGVPDDYERW